MKTPFVGIIAFVIVLLTMPLGHAAMILMEKALGHDFLYWGALILGFIGMIALMAGMLANKDLKATLLGLFGGLLVWTGWIEFAFVYYAHRFNIEPLISNGEVVTKPEYLIMPSSIGFWAIFMFYYLAGSKNGCRFFIWLQDKLHIRNKIKLKSEARTPALTTFMELTMLLWTFYLVLLFAYDNHFAGDKHLITYIVAFASLLWSLFLFMKLIKIKELAYALRYAIPTVIIFWNFVEILGRWGLFKEIWIEPHKYEVELSLMLLVLIILTIKVIINNIYRKKVFTNSNSH